MLPRPPANAINIRKIAERPRDCGVPSPDKIDPEHSDELHLPGINRFSGANRVLANVPAGGIEAMTFNFDRSGLFSPDGSTLGLTDRITGGWTPSPASFGSGTGV